MNATGSEYGAALSKFEGGEDGNDAASPAKDFEEDISHSLSLSVFVFLPFKNAWYCNNNSELRASCEVLLSSISEEKRRAERQRRGDASGSERETNKLSRAHHRRVLFSLLSLLLLLLQS